MIGSYQFYNHDTLHQLISQQYTSMLFSSFQYKNCGAILCFLCLAYAQRTKKSGLNINGIRAMLCSSPFLHTKFLRFWSSFLIFLLLMFLSFSRFWSFYLFLFFLVFGRYIALLIFHRDTRQAALCGVIIWKCIFNAYKYDVQMSCMQYAHNHAAEMIFSIWEPPELR